MNVKQTNLSIILQWISLLVIISASIFYLFKTRPEQIRTKTKAICDSKLPQYKQDAAKFSKIERDRHQVELLKLSDLEKKLPENSYLIEKWSNENIERYEKQQWEQSYNACISRGEKY